MKHARAANALANATFWPDSRPSRPVHFDGPSDAELDAAVETARRAWWPVRSAAIKRLMQLVADEPHAAQIAEEQRLKGLKAIELDLALEVYATRLSALETPPTTDALPPEQATPEAPSEQQTLEVPPKAKYSSKVIARARYNVRLANAAEPPGQSDEQLVAKLDISARTLRYYRKVVADVGLEDA